MKRTIPWGAILVTVVAVAGLCLLCVPIYGKRTGSPSSGALSAVYGIMDSALEEASKNTDHCFRFADATAEQREKFGHWARKRPPGSRCFIAPKIVFDSREPRQIVVFCDTPRPESAKQWFQWFSSPELKHAVAYSDGAKRLISVSDFALLDRTNFLPVTESRRE